MGIRFIIEAPEEKRIISIALKFCVVRTLILAFYNLGFYLCNIHKIVFFLYDLKIEIWKNETTSKATEVHSADTLIFSPPFAHNVEKVRPNENNHTNYHRVTCFHGYDVLITERKPNGKEAGRQKHRKC